MADDTDMENSFIGTFDSSGAFVSLKVGLRFGLSFSITLKTISQDVVAGCKA